MDKRRLVLGTVVPGLGRLKGWELKNGQSFDRGPFKDRVPAVIRANGQRMPRRSSACLGGVGLALEARRLCCRY